jgi:hypothetical protein
MARFPEIVGEFAQKNTVVMSDEDLMRDYALLHVAKGMLERCFKK